MENQLGTSPREGDSGVDRRRLLQGAVAAGVGVVAWSSPSISSIGGTPAYAATCTGGTQRWFLGHRNTSCDCWGEDGVSKFVSYKALNTNQCQGASPDPAREVTFSFGNSGQCPPTTFEDQAGTVEGQAAATFSARTDPDTPRFCVVSIDVVDGNCSNVVLASVNSGIVDVGGGTVPMPPVNCASSGQINASNVFLRVYLECADDDACLMV